MTYVEWPHYMSHNQEINGFLLRHLLSISSGKFYEANTNGELPTQKHEVVVDRRLHNVNK